MRQFNDQGAGPNPTMDMLHRDLSSQNRPGSCDVLVVDDEEGMRTLLDSVLKASGLTVRCAENGRTALRLLAQQHFRLIVTDIHMPEMDGLEIIMHCTAALPKVRIVAISGGGVDDAPNVLKTARLLGGLRTLVKPFPVGEFLSAVHELLKDGTR